MTGRHLQVFAMLSTIRRHRALNDEAPGDEAALEAATSLAAQAKESSAKLRSVYGRELDLDHTSGESLLQVERVRNVLGTKVVISATSGTELQAKLAKYVDSSNNEGDGALWPVVQRVWIAGPWELLLGGLKLIDAPGTHDSNAARDRVVKDKIATADVVLLVSNIRRAVNDKSIKDWLSLSLRQTMTQAQARRYLSHPKSPIAILTFVQKLLAGLLTHTACEGRGNVPCRLQGGIPCHVHPFTAPFIIRAQWSIQTLGQARGVPAGLAAII